MDTKSLDKLKAPVLFALASLAITQADTKLKEAMEYLAHLGNFIEGDSEGVHHPSVLGNIPVVNGANSKGEGGTVVGETTVND